MTTETSEQLKVVGQAGPCGCCGCGCGGADCGTSTTAAEAGAALNVPDTSAARDCRCGVGRSTFRPSFSPRTCAGTSSRRTRRTPLLASSEKLLSVVTASA